MIPYYLLLVLPVLYIILSQACRSYVGTENHIGGEKRNIAMLVFFAWLLLLLVCRDETIGRDLPVYKEIFGYSRDGLQYVFSSWQEVLFRLYNWAFYQITENYQTYLAITAVLTILPIGCLYVHSRGHSYLMLVLFVNMSTFIMLFSGIRQALAMGIGVIAYHFVKKRKKLAFLLCVFVALLIHHSGFMLLLMYPLYYLRMKRKYIPFLIPAVVVVLLFNNQIFSFLTSLLSANDKYDSTTTSTGAYGSLILFALMAIFAYVITDESLCDEETLGVRNYLLLAVFLQCFAPIHSLAMRMNYYYILFIPFAMGKCLTYPRKYMRQIAQLGEVVLCVFFTAMFVISTYQSYLTGISTLDTIPYKVFWKG